MRSLALLPRERGKPRSVEVLPRDMEPGRKLRVETKEAAADDGAVADDGYAAGTLLPVLFLLWLLKWCGSGEGTRRAARLDHGVVLDMGSGRWWTDRGRPCSTSKIRRRRDRRTR